MLQNSSTESLPSSKARPANILLADDSRDDYDLMAETLKFQRMATKLYHVEDGEQCMNFLRQLGNYSGAPKPDVILLDLNMPVMDGIEVLQEMSEDPQFKQIPVILLTSPDHYKDVSSKFSMVSSTFISKPVDVEKLNVAVKDLGKYWFTVIISPEEANYEKETKL